MQFPKSEKLKEFIKSIGYLKTLEATRNKEDYEIFKKLINKKISEKDAYTSLKTKNLLTNSKLLDTKVITELINYNKLLIEISTDFGIIGVKKYKLKNRSSGLLKILSGKKLKSTIPGETKQKEEVQKQITPIVQETPKSKIPVTVVAVKPEPVIIVEKPKEVPTAQITMSTSKASQREETNKSNVITEPIISPKTVSQDIPRVEKKVQVTENKNSSVFNSLNELFIKNKPIETEKPVLRPEIVVQTPEFEVPKDLLPENYQILIPGFAYAFIQEMGNTAKRYTVAEPELTKEEAKVLEETKTSLINKISIADLTNESQIYEMIEKLFAKNKIRMDKSQKDKIVYYIIRQVNGLDRIEALMHDTLIEDIECNGIGIPIFIVHRKYGHIVTNVQFDTEKELQQFIIKMAHLSKSYVSYASPLLDAILPDGSRVNATLTSNVSTRGPTFTIRKFPQKPLTAIDLINSGTLNSTIASYLWTALEFKKNMILIGPTAGGKTTLLNVISSFIAPAQRVVSIEDTREINLLMENWIPQITRPGFGPPDSSGKKYGEVTMLDLLKESFRQRPDYLILGEVRGEEMSLMFQGMASGHCSLSTVHSKSVESLVTRLTTPPISLDPSLLTCLDIVIVTGFKGSNETNREIKELDEIRGFNVKTRKVEYNAIYKSYEKEPEQKEGDLFTTKLPIIYNSDLLKDISREHNIEPNALLALITARKNFIDTLCKNPPKDYVAFKIALNNYKATEAIKID